MKYRVYGHTTVTVSTLVEADSEEEAIEKANCEFGGIMSYAGNGGMDKLIGVDGEYDTIEANESVEFDDAAEE